jgi:hypothetical protein
MAMSEDQERFCAVLREALVEAWSEVPRKLQERLFERAVVLGHRTERDEALRQQLARFLHDHHRRTAHAAVSPPSGNSAP